jgi:hypothetical protein
LIAKLDSPKSDIFPWHQLCLGWTEEVSYHKEDPLIADELQITQRLERHEEDYEVHVNDIFNNLRLNRNSVNDDIEENDENFDLVRLELYCFSAYYYLQRYFCDCTIWYYHLKFENEKCHYLDTEYEIRTIIDELESILSRIGPCFQKIYAQLETVHPDPAYEIKRNIRVALQGSEENIRERIGRLSKSISSLDWSFAKEEVEGSVDALQISLLEGPEHTKPIGTLWTHITISRDQTRSSEFRKLQLLVLQPRRYQSNVRQTQPVSSGIPAGGSTPFYHPLHLPDQTLDSHKDIHLAGSDLLNTTIMSSSNSSQTDEIRQQMPEDHDSAYQPSNDLLDRISILEAANRNLRSIQGSGDEIEVIYSIVESSRHTTAYVDEPTWAIGPRGEVILKAHFPVPDMEGYLRQKHNTAISVQKHYNLEDQHDEVRKAARNKQKLPALRSTAETMRLESQDMIDAFRAFLSNNPVLERELPASSTFTFTAPYLFWFHHRSTITMDGLSKSQKSLMSILVRWIDSNYGELYSQVEKQLARGVVSYDSMPFLMRIGDAVLVSQEMGQQIRGVVAESYLTSTTPRTRARSTEPQFFKQILGEKDQYWAWTGKVWSYKYDGSFYQQRETIEITMPADDVKEEIPITDLNAFPMRFAKEETKTHLERRGTEFWACREKRLVSYNDKNGIYGV